MLKLFKLSAILEGLSFIVLLLNMFITKRIDTELYLSLRLIIGMIHGLLFLTYVLLAIVIKAQMKWSGSDFFIILVASIIPFATFWVERKYITEKYIKST